MGLKYKGLYPVRGWGSEHFFKCRCGQTLRITKSKLDASIICGACGYEWRTKNLQRPIWIAKKLESIREWYAAWFLDAGYLPWIFTVVSGIVFWYCWADLVTLQIDANVPPDWVTTRSWLGTMIFLIYSGLIYGICAVVDKGWTRKTISILCFMLGLTCIYASWYQSRDSLLGRYEQKAIRAGQVVEYIKRELSARQEDKEVVAHYQRILPELQNRFDSADADYLKQLDLPETGRNYSGFLRGTGWVLLVVALLFGVATLFTANRAVMESSRKRSHLLNRRRDLKSLGTFGKTVYLSFTCCLGMVLLIVFIGYAAGGLWIIGSLLRSLMHSLS